MKAAVAWKVRLWQGELDTRRVPATPQRKRRERNPWSPRSSEDRVLGRPCVTGELTEQSGKGSRGPTEKSSCRCPGLKPSAEHWLVLQSERALQSWAKQHRWERTVSWCPGLHLDSCRLLPWMMGSKPWEGFFESLRCGQISYIFLNLTLWANIVK